MVTLMYVLLERSPARGRLLKLLDALKIFVCLCVRKKSGGKVQNSQNHFLIWGRTSK